jgi:phospholipid/cholesterol/gamma-HCH transport system substrate-binding protein
VRYRTEIIVGLVVLLGIVTIVGGTLWLQGVVLGREEVRVEATFREVGQLGRGNTVKLRGVPIGRVDDVQLLPDGNGVQVTLRIRRDAPLPRDPVVLLSPESLFGDWQAEIHPRSRFPQYSYAEVGAAGGLPGYSLPDISQLTQVADRIAENLAVLTDRVEIAFTEETALRVRQAIENIQEVSGELTGLVQRQQATMDALAADLHTTTATMGEAAESVRRIATEVEGAVGGGAVVSIVGNVQRATAQIDTLTSQLAALSGDFRSAVAGVDTAFQSLELITGQVARGQGTLGMMLQDTALYAEMVRTNETLQRLLRDVQENPRRYINLRIF